MSNITIIFIVLIVLFVIIYTSKNKNNDLKIDKETDIHNREYNSEFMTITKDIEDDVITGDDALCSIILIDAPNHKKIGILKEIRYITSAGLAEAKDLIENAPSTILTNIPYAKAKEIKNLLISKGAIVQIKSSEDN